MCGNLIYYLNNLNIVNGDKKYVANTFLFSNKVNKVNCDDNKNNTKQFLLESSKTSSFGTKYKRT